MKRISRTSRREPAISLINIIFLILIFFMVSGTLARPLPASVELVQTSGFECCSGPRILAVAADGSLSMNGEPVEGLEPYFSEVSSGDGVARMAPDRRLPAQALITLVADLRDLGAGRVVIVTETATP